MSHTPGPWRWEINEKSKSVHLVGGKPQFDLTILDAERWGMSSATLRLRDVAHDGMNVMHRIHERRDWVAPFPGREHHTDWCAAVRHPDMQLIEAAPDMLEVLEMALELLRNIDPYEGQEDILKGFIDICVAVIAKATGEAQ